MERNWSRVIAEILSSEGGYSNNPRDPGGPTNLGVTIENFRRFVKPDGTIDDLKALTRDQAAVVFRRQYWDQVMGSALPDGVDYCVCDFAVNSGDTRAEELAQTIAGADVDGAIGPKTLAAIAAVAPAVFIGKYCDERLAFLKRIKDKKTGALLWDEFGGGWQIRVEKVRRIALQMADQPVIAPVIEVKTVEVEKPVGVPVVPKGADKPGIGRWMASVPLLGTAVTAFGGFDNVTKGIILGLVFLGVVALLFRGEQIAARAKAVVASFEILMLTFILVHIPLPVYIGLALLVLLALGYLFHLPTKSLLWVAALLVLALFAPALAQRGFKAKEEQDMKEADKAIERARDAREKANELNADPNHLRDTDGNRRD